MINKILVPVDFSRTSSNAIRYAGEIANVSGSEIFAVHVFKGSPDLKSKTVVLEERLSKFVSHSLRYKDNIKSTVKYSFHVVGNPDFIQGILSSGLLNEMDLVVMGTKGAKGLFKRMFVGSNTFDLAQKINKPLIAVPEGSTFWGVKRIAFFSDFKNDENINCLQPMKELALLFNSEIKICHVRNSDSKEDQSEHTHVSREEDKFLGKEVAHTFKIISSTSVLKGLNDYIHKKKNLEMIIAVVNHRRSSMDSLLKTDHTRRMVFQAKKPVLILNG